MDKAIDYRTLDVQLSHLTTRQSGDGTMKISGYAALYNQPSQPLPFIEYIKPGAFDGVDLSDVLLLYGHDPNQILARTNANSLSLNLDDKGLAFSATLPDTTLGHDTYNNILAGNLRGCSFGFTIADGGENWSQDQNGQTIHNVTKIGELEEISVTPIPAYNETSVAVQRSLNKFKEETRNMATDKSQATNSSAVASSATSAASSANSNASSAFNMEDFARALVGAVKSVAKRDDDSDEPIEMDAKPMSGSNAESAAASASNSANSASSASTSASASSAASSAVQKRDAQPAEEEKSETQEKKEGTIKMRSLSNEAKADKVTQFREFLQTGKITRDLAVTDANAMPLQSGEVIIPSDIMTPEHEQYQFPRLGSMVRTVSVKHTTGKLPVFYPGSDQLQEHTEFSETPATKAPEVKAINWDLHTFTGRYVFSQDLLSDSDYNWQSELQSRLIELRDNTDDAQITTALTKNITPVKPDDLVNQLKEILNMKLKPMDSRAAGMLLSQSAYNALDQLKDKEDRPLLQPDLTQGTGNRVLGKTVTVVDDTLFPNAKAGDVNIIVTPFQKAVINFKSNEITGQFQDTYDIWYKQLGIYLRQDVEQARPDLINWISSTTGAAAAAKTLTTK